VENTSSVQHAILKRDTVRLNLQVVQAASVQKRDVVQDTIARYTAFVNATQQQIQACALQTHILLHSMRNQTANVTVSVTAQVAEQFASVIGCDPTEATGILGQIGMLLHQLY